MNISISNAGVTISPFGFGSSLENDEEANVTIILTNTGDNEVAFSFSLETKDFAELDDLDDMNVLIFTDDRGWGGTHAMVEGAEAAGIPDENVTEVRSDRADNIDLDEYGVIVWCDSHSNAYYQNYNDNNERFEEWVDAGGILIATPADGGVNPAFTLPGRVARDNGNTDPINIVVEGADLENPFIAGDPDDDEDDFATQITGSSCSHQAFPVAEFEDNDEIENSQILYVVERARNRATIATYEYGGGHVCASTLTVSAHWYW